MRMAAGGAALPCNLTLPITQTLIRPTLQIKSVQLSVAYALPLKLFFMRNLAGGTT